MQNDAITEALQSLDPATDSHWTKAGLPSVDVVSDLVGAKVTRAQIEEVAPGFVRPEGAGGKAEEPSYEDRLAELDAAMAAKQEEILQLHRDVGAAKKRIEQLTEERRALREERQSLRTPEVRALEYKRYLASVQEQRRKRVENEQKIRELTGKRIDLGPPCNRPDPRPAGGTG